MSQAASSLSDSTSEEDNIALTSSPPEESNVKATIGTESNLDPEQDTNDGNDVLLRCWADNVDKTKYSEGKDSTLPSHNIHLQKKRSKKASEFLEWFDDDDSTNIKEQSNHEVLDDTVIIKNQKVPKASQQNPFKVWKENRRQNSNGPGIWQGVQRWSPNRNQSHNRSLGDAKKIEDLQSSISAPTSAPTLPSVSGNKPCENEMEQIVDKETVFFEQVESRSEERRIGTLKVEVLSCEGLSKFDRFSKAKITTYLICGDAAFATDPMASLSPTWPAQSKHAAEFPLFHAYAKLYVGVFSATEREADDFAGRTVINMSSLRPNVDYDVVLPLKISAIVYDQRYRGTIRLRFQLHWSDERCAVLSYLPTIRDLPWIGDHQKSNFVGIPCADGKTLKNVAHTIFGEDMPSKFSRKAFRATTREMGLYKININHAIKSTFKNIMMYEKPVVSIYALLGWMGICYYRRIDLVPSFLISFVIIIFYRNYIKFCKSQEHLDVIHRPMSIETISSMLLKGGGIDMGLWSANKNDRCSTQSIESAEEEYQEFPFSDATIGPEQNDEKIDAKEGNLFKKNFEELETRLQTATGHIFHQYVSRQIAPNFTSTSESCHLSMLPQKVYPEPQTKLTNPLAAFSASFLEPIMKAIEVYLLIVRGAFNAFNWKDPYLSFWIVIFLVIAMVILALFPWQKFFYAAGIICVGPQNWIIKCILATTKSEEAEPEGNLKQKTDSCPKDRSIDSESKAPTERQTSANEKVSTTQDSTTSVKTKPPLFHTKHSIKWQNQRKKGQDEQLYEIIVPYRRFNSERFYFWPPKMDQSHGENSKSNCKDIAVVKDVEQDFSGKNKYV